MNHPTTHPAPSSLAGLPEPVRTRVQELVAALTSALGNQLVALVCYGSAVRGDFVPDRSDVDLVLVLRDDDPELLSKLGPALRLARAAARIETMIVTMDELARAADVFPLLYDDIKRRHVLLVGRDVFAELVIHDEHRRLRIEQQLRDARIRLRRTIAAEGLESGTLAEPLTRNVRELRGTLVALLRLQGVDVGDGLADVLAAAGRAWSVNVNALLAPGADLRARLFTLRQLMNAAIAAVDALERSA